MAARRTGATTRRCPSCGAAVIKQFVEVLDITANTQPITPGTDAQHRTPHHLTWCAPPSRAANSPPRLRWIYTGTHPDPCPHPHHAEHRCTTTRPPADPTQQPAQPGLF